MGPPTPLSLPHLHFCHAMRTYTDLDFSRIGVGICRRDCSGPPTGRPFGGDACYMFQGATQASPRARPRGAAVQAAIQSGGWQACWCASVVSRTLGACLRRLARSSQLAVDLVGVVLGQLGNSLCIGDPSHIPARRAGGPVGVTRDSGRSRVLWRSCV